MKLPITMVVELNRRLILGYEQYKDDERIITLKKAVLSYNRQLMALQIRDHQVKYAQMSWFKALWLMLSRLVKLAVMSVLVIPGAVLFAPVFILGKMISIRKSKEALAASTVKVKGNDVMATWKVLVALVAAPTAYVFYTAVACVWYLYNNVNGWFSYDINIFAFGAIVFSLLVSTSFAALRIGEVGMDIVKSLRPLAVALSPWHGHQLRKLRERRTELSREVTALINELGPEIFPDFNSRRIIKSSTLDSPRVPRHSHPGLTEESDAESVSQPSTPTSPSSPVYSGYSHARSLPRNDSLHNLSNIPLFSSRPSSRPGTPHHPRSLSRSGSFGAGGEGVMGFTPLIGNEEDLHRKIQSSLRERSVRRKSLSGNAYDSGTSTPASEFEGLTMTKKRE
jgi:glycerol-3-phosphate O-acyltransferase/dihydroxyacetone phosphate acyltransferase